MHADPVPDWVLVARPNASIGAAGEFWLFAKRIYILYMSELQLRKGGALRSSKAEPLLKRILGR